MTGGFIDQLSLRISVKGKEVPYSLKTASESWNGKEGSTPLLRHQLLWCIFNSTGKRWRTYWKYVKWHSIMGRWGTLPAENRGLKPAQGPSPLKPSGAVPFWSLTCCVIEWEFTVEDKRAIFQSNWKQRERNVLCCWKTSSSFILLMMSVLSFIPRVEACFPPFRGSHLYLFLFKVNMEPLVKGILGRISL